MPPRCGSGWPALRRMPGFATDRRWRVEPGARGSAARRSCASSSARTISWPASRGRSSRSMGRPDGRTQGAAWTLFREDRGPAVEALRGLSTSFAPSRPGGEGRTGARWSSRPSTGLLPMLTARASGWTRHKPTPTPGTGTPREGCSRVSRTIGAPRARSRPGPPPTRSRSSSARDNWRRPVGDWPRHGPALSGDDRDALRLRLVPAGSRKARSPRADSALGADSTVEALALAGRIRLYRGDVAGADRATSGRPARTRVIAPTPRSEPRCWRCCNRSNPIRCRALGRGVLQLERGDTSHAVGTLEEVARGLPPAKGGAERRAARRPTRRGTGAITPMRSGCSTRPPRRRRPVPRPPRSWRWVSCCSRSIAPPMRSRNWSISFSRIPRARSSPRLGGGSTRRAARCPRHETARLPRTRRRRAPGAFPAGLARPAARRQRAVAARAHGRRPGRSPQGLRAGVPPAGARRPGRMVAQLSERIVPASRRRGDRAGRRAQRRHDRAAR